MRVLGFAAGYRPGDNWSRVRDQHLKGQTTLWSSAVVNGRTSRPGRRAPAPPCLNRRYLFCHQRRILVLFVVVVFVVVGLVVGLVVIVDVFVLGVFVL